MQDKYNSLCQNLRSLQRVVIAYSGGVDSTFLLKAAVDTLGKENILACIAVSGSLAESQHAQALRMAEAIGIPIREVPVDELQDVAYVANKADRCFHCKSHLFSVLKRVAEQEGFEHILCGSNFDDKDDFRPGNRAATQMGIHAPLMEAELTKADIRQLSRQLGLATAEMPASPCLASRIQYGLEITEERLKQVEKAEDFLRSLGLVEFRVRHHGDIARIEVRSSDILKIANDPIRTQIVEKLKGLDFRFVSLDLQGFRSGALNEALSEEQKRQNR
ncbi:MAG: ATP-dependent sacrificial sulfur transferase LarE [Sedimentisphaerales bacterium]|nr:ATP-dependent sacrificial sulfur transferase LarE [Sedimentisphaerales bacterium]